ncbi:MAG: type II toxin-antitoxin system RelE/ParE family toxin [Clostridiales bacterium]|nr:type II toxin-antitoxin system RelE/ParE family toxin [Clostridiales bacterium]
MRWKARARQDIRSIYLYIANELLASETAAGQIQRITKEIRSLEKMPMQFRLTVIIRFKHISLGRCFLSVVFISRL